MHGVEESVDDTARRRHGPGDHPRERRVDTGLEERDPEPHGPDERDPELGSSHMESAVDHDREEPGDQQPDGSGLRAVEDGDDQDGSQIVDDREREEEHPHLTREAAADHREDRERERDVGRHRDAPPVRGGA